MMEDMTTYVYNARLSDGQVSFSSILCTKQILEALRTSMNNWSLQAELLEICDNVQNDSDG